MCNILQKFARNMVWTYFVSVGLLTMSAIPIRYIEGFLLETNTGPCNYTNDRVTCTSRGLSQVPTFNGNLNKGPCNDFQIEVNDNQITRVENDAFSMFQSLNCSSISLSLADNNISYIADNAFRGMEGRITSLNLSSNCFTTLPVGVGVLYKLGAFQILDNPLQNLNADVIAILGQTLTSFYFDIASMQNWPTELHFLRELEYLYIRNIPFEQLSTSAFYGLNNLRSLIIDHSLLQKISAAYCDLKKLYRIGLSRNYNFNQTGSNIFEQCHNGLRTPRVFSFRDNSMDFFPTITYSFHVQYVIDARHNNMRYMDADDISIDNTTSYILLSSNLFTRIPTGLYNFKSLSRLKLDDNKIEYIHDTDLQGLSELQSLTLDSNPIRFITKNAFNGNPKLSALSLSRTRLSQIPEALTTIASLRNLDLSGTYIECTCGMAHLNSWNITRIYFNSAKCYQTNEMIEDFIRDYVDKGRCST